MITGVVNAKLEAIVRVIVRGPAGPVRRMRAVIDTGFSGYLTLPPSVIADLGLVWKDTGSAILADGTETDFELYAGTVVWDRRNRTIAVDEADTTPLVGTALLAGYRLNSEFRPRGKVMIKQMRWRG